jgi:ankyrin repeat protein
MQAKPELIGLLLDAGAQTNFRDVNGFTPLFYARMQPDNPELAQLLLSHGAENR